MHMLRIYGAAVQLVLQKLCKWMEGFALFYLGLLLCLTRGAREGILFVLRLPQRPTRTRARTAPLRP